MLNIQYKICITVTIILALLLCVNKKLTIEKVCKDIGITCSVVYEEGKPNAYVTGKDNIIHISGGLEESLTDEELLAVELHELGHIVLKHHKRMNDEIWITNHRAKKVLTREQFCSISRQHEYEADKFSYELSKKYKLKKTLADVFNKQFKGTPQYITDYCTHPSIQKRIQHMEN